MKDKDNKGEIYFTEEAKIAPGSDWRKVITFPNTQGRFLCNREGFRGFDRCTKQCKGCKALSE